MSDYTRIENKNNIDYFKSKESIYSYFTIDKFSNRKVRNRR